jgi:hypothetical protein
MPETPLNASQQVERIREILVGRQMYQVEDRLRRLEEGGGVAPGPEGSRVEQAAIKRLEESQSAVIQHTNQLRKQLVEEAELRNQQIGHLAEHLNRTTQRIEAASSGLGGGDEQLELQLSEHLEHISSAMAARIDARVREILQHLQSELVHWKSQMDREMQGMREQKADRRELQSRFARLASAAMEDDPPQSAENDGFLL